MGALLWGHWPGCRAGCRGRGSHVAGLAGVVLAERGGAAGDSRAWSQGETLVERYGVLPARLQRAGRAAACTCGIFALHHTACAEPLVCLSVAADFLMCSLTCFACITDQSSSHQDKLV